jgi:putative two-component system response regulator
MSGLRSASRILVVDDLPENIRVLRRILMHAGYRNVAGTTEPASVPDLVRHDRPDLIVLDLEMPGMSGLAVLRELRTRSDRDDFLPVIVITGNVTREAREQALETGANDFVTQPFDRTDVLLRIRNLLHTRDLHLRLQAENEKLEQRLDERSRALSVAHAEVLERLGRVAEFRSDASGSEAKQVARAAARIARALGLTRRDALLIEQAALPYDIGMSAIPDRILLKRGRVNEDEKAIIRLHTAYGGQLLAGGSSEVVRMAESIAMSHHERWDGTGYPLQLSGEDIPLPARIVGLADLFVALRRERPYRSAFPLESALAEVAATRNRQFESPIVNAFLSLSWEDGAW